MAQIVELASVRHVPDGAAVVPNVFTIDLCVGDMEDFFDDSVTAYWLLGSIVTSWLFQHGAHFARMRVELTPLTEGEDEAAAEGRFRIV